MAYMIMDEVKRLEYNEKINRSCDVSFNINDECYNLKIYVGKNNFIIIEYNDMKFKCKDKERYEYLLQYFIEYFLSNNNADISYKIEWDNYDPYIDENYNKLLINVESNNKLIFRHFFNDVDVENIVENIKDCLLPLYYITI